MTRIDVPAEVAAIFDEFADRPFVAYPSLTRDELFALGDSPLFVDTDDAAWWGGLAEDTRPEVLASAQRGLLARGLVDIDSTDNARLDVSSRLRILLALRAAPAFVTLVGNYRHPSPILRCYGVLGPDERVAVLVEARVITGVAEYLLCRPNYAATTVARLLLAPPDTEDPEAVPAPDELGARMVRRRLELFPPGSMERGRRFLAHAGLAAGALAEVDADGHAGPAREATEQSVVDLVTESWAADAVATFDELVEDGRS